MEVLIQQNNFFSKILGKQEYNAEVKYRMLGFCVETEVDGVGLLYNNLTKELISLTKEEAEILKSKDFSSSHPFITYLVENRFLVPYNHDDATLRNQVLSFARGLERQDSITTFDILPTTDCNARCFYCFEYGVCKKNMTAETAKEVAEYVIRKSNGNKVNINWFGGEPSLNCEAIDIICNILTARGVEFNSTMVSNAYLLDKSVAKKAAEKWNLKAIQVTIDGKKDTYNRVKNYIYNDSDAYGRVLNNIDCLMENKIQVLIRLNMDRHNADELDNLLDELICRFNGNKYCLMHVVLLYENTGISKHLRTDTERIMLAEKYDRLTEKIKHAGFSKNRILLKNSIATHRCMTDSLSSIMILPDGKLGKCEHHLDDELLGDIKDNPQNIRWGDYVNPILECAKCPVYPTCFLLKGCEYYQHDCYEYERRQKIAALKENIQYTYKKLRAKKNNEV